MKFLLRPIFWILIFAFVLRLWGITYGFPLFLVNDEPALVLGALKMIELQTLIPAWHEAEFRAVLSYPPFSSYFYLVTLAPVLAVHYLFSGLPPLDAYKDAVTLNPSFLWIAARIINALLGVAMIALVYRIARRVTESERASLLAAIFLSLSFYHLQLSHVVRHWMPAALLVYAAWLAALKIRETASAKPYLGAGLLAGIGMGVNTSAIIALLPAAMEHFFKPAVSWRSRLFAPRLLAMAGAALAMAALATALYPYGFTRAEGAGTVGADLAMRVARLANISLGEWVSFLGGYFRLFITAEPTFAIAAVLGVIVSFWNRSNRRFIFTVAVFSVAYLTLLYLFFNAIPRALIFLLPALAVLAGYGVDRLLLWLQNRFSSGILPYAICALLFFAYPFITDLRYDYLASRADTRLVAVEWIGANIPAGSKILGDFQYLRLTNTQEGIRELQRIDPTGLRAQDRVLLRRDPSAYPAPAHNVLNLHFVSNGKPERGAADSEFFRERGYRYLVVEYRYANGVDLNSRTRELLKGLARVKRFDPFGRREFPWALDLSGEIDDLWPHELFQFARFGRFVDIYEL